MPETPTESAHGPESLKEGIRRGIEFLEQDQLPHGEFPTHLGTGPGLQQAIHDSSAFMTTHVLFSIRDIEWPGKEALVHRALSFFEEQREIGSIWRYYSNRQWKHCRIPPDMDSTSCISQCIKWYGGEPPANLAVMERMRNSDGLYYTWIGPLPHHRAFSRIRMIRFLGERIARKRLAEMPAEFSRMERFALPEDAVPLDDVDPVVNANVLLYLGPCALTDAIPAYLHQLIRGKHLENYSLYYHNPLVMLYAASRAYAMHDLLTKEIAEDINSAIGALERTSELENSAQNHALEANVLGLTDQRNPRLSHLIGELLKQQNKDGSWNMEAFYSGPTEHWGCTSLTTALAIEALDRYRHSCRPGVETTSSVKP